MSKVFILVILLTCGALAVRAQSSDQNLPTAVLSNDINGKIVALDVGDPRTTHHFYAFAANPGDLLITVDSKNLDGDVDIFTAITFRPLMKTTVYASSRSPSVTKGIYLRAHQVLVLRVEARTPNDDPGTYHIHFGGTFEAFSGGIPVAENTETADSSNEKSSSNRLSSVGATIPRPPAEIRETPEPKSSASATEPAPTARTSTARPPRRSTRPSTSRRQPPAKKPEAPPKTQSDDAEAKTEAAKTEKSVSESSTRKSSESAPPADASKTQEAAAQPGGARLIIEQKDGTRIERPMSTVRRVIVEGPTILVILKNGKTERIPMIAVVRMAIEPQ